MLALTKRLRGVFNVSGPQPLPLSVIIRETGRRPFLVPEPIFRFMMGRFGLPRLPPGALSHIKYPVVIDSAPFRAATGFEHAYDEYVTLREFRESD